MSDLKAEMRKFDQALSAATQPQHGFVALAALIAATVGSKLTTVTMVDMPAMLVHRAFTTDEAAYPVSGTKPIVKDAYYDQVHIRHGLFVVHTMAEMMPLFPDHAQIKALGCESAVNLPVCLENTLVATVNILHEENHYTPERIALIEVEISIAAKAALLLFQRMGGL